MALINTQTAVRLFVAAGLGSAALLLAATLLWGSWFVFAAACLAVGSAPSWLPGRVVALRMHLLTSINDGSGGSGEGVQVPNAEVDCEGFRMLYRSKAAGGRSVGAGLSDLFWYFLSPGPEVHPEQLENGPKYNEVALVLKRALGAPREEAQAALLKLAEQMVDSLSGGVSVVRLRDLFMPLFARFYHDMLFREEASDEIVEKIVRYAHNVIQALKWCELRDMPARLEVTDYVLAQVRKGGLRPGLCDDVTHLSDEELALMLQGAFLNSGVVQSSEAMAHAILALAQHPDIARTMVAEPPAGYVSGFVSECLRLWPLFGIAHRILTEDVELPSGSTLPAGTVVCFNYPEYHSRGYDEPDVLNPMRWQTLKRSEANYLPFGMPGNRPCPAQRLAVLSMETLVPHLAQFLEFASPVMHSRSLPGRGLCAVAPRPSKSPRQRRIARGCAAASSRPMQAALWVLDQADSVSRSLAQLACASAIVSDAKRLRLCQRYFEGGEQLLKVDQEF
eukprot:TRINITY_DN24022_c0_g1_i1.p1 TRINITY_DN24022_c0_g1~~TRINITY_DN24022_c0_g1_i1.p1  ORF type:complete len:536 (+),score=202.91 TRINITY_DN24022_c0_g1_i1:93-1610(+)